MKTTPTLAALAALTLLAGCQTTEQMLAAEQGIAQQTALRRGQFELNCPAATASLLSSQILQPVVWRGIERAEYTVGIEGCGQRRTYIVICPLDSSSCVATAGR